MWWRYEVLSEMWVMNISILFRTTYPSVYKGVVYKRPNSYYTLIVDIFQLKVRGGKYFWLSEGEGHNDLFIKTVG
jgi:hypothetical protein